MIEVPTEDFRVCRGFVEEVVRTGLMLVELLETVLEDLPDDAFPGERPVDVLLGMLAGSLWPAAEAAGMDRVREATALVGSLADRTVADLQAALESG